VRVYIFHELLRDIPFQGLSTNTKHLLASSEAATDGRNDFSVKLWINEKVLTERLY
jgi:hypothetical protein